MTIEDAIRTTVQNLIREKGRGCVVPRQAIVDRVVKLRNVPRGSILPSDYCYNRVNRGIDFSKPTFFLYCGHDKYACLGEGDDSYTGNVYCRPVGKQEDFVAGYCVAGVRRTIRFWYMQLHPGNDPVNFGPEVMRDVLLQWHDVGMGSAAQWRDGGEDTRRRFKDEMQIGDVIALAHGRRYIALVRVTGEMFRNDKIAGRHWYGIARPVEVLSDNHLPYVMDYVNRRHEVAAAGLPIRSTLALVKTNRFVEYWYQRVGKGVAADECKAMPRTPRKGRVAASSAWVRDARVAAEALRSGVCACCGTDKTFARRDGRQYMEAHHLLPLAACQGDFATSLDVVANVVCVCPQCHRFLHHGQRDAVRRVLSGLYDKRKALLAASGISLSKGAFLSRASEAR